MTRLLPALAASLALAACGVTTTKQAFTPELIRQVGAGSVAEARLVPTLNSLKVSGGLNDPATAQTLVYLLEGRLGKLTPADLARLAEPHLGHVSSLRCPGGRCIRRSMMLGSASQHGFTTRPDGASDVLSLPESGGCDRCW